MRRLLSMRVRHLFPGTLFFLVLLGAVFFLVPTAVVAAETDGGLIPCGKSFGSSDERAPCTVCHIVVAGNNVIKWGLGIMTVIAVTVMFAMAVLYVVSAGNPGMMQTAKGGIVAALIGFSIMLSAWLIVNTVLTILVDNEGDANQALTGLVQNGVFKFECDQSSNANRRP